MSSVEAFWKKLKLKERATRFFSQKQRSSPPVEQKPQTQAKPDPLVQEKTTSKAAGTEIGVPVEMPESKATKGKRLDRGDIKVWEVKEVGRKFLCGFKFWPCAVGSLPVQGIHCFIPYGSVLHNGPQADSFRHTSHGSTFNANSEKVPTMRKIRTWCASQMSLAGKYIGSILRRDRAAYGVLKSRTGLGKYNTVVFALSSTLKVATLR